MLSMTITELMHLKNHRLTDDKSIDHVTGTSICMSVTRTLLATVTKTCFDTVATYVYHSNKICTLSSHW